MWGDYTRIPLLSESGIGGRTLKHKSHTLSPKFCDRCPRTFHYDVLAQSEMRFSRASPHLHLNHHVLWMSFPGPWTAEVSSPITGGPLLPRLLLRPCILCSTVMWGGSPPAGRPQGSCPTAGLRGPEEETCFIQEAPCCGSGVTCHCGHWGPDCAFPLKLEALMPLSGAGCVTKVSLRVTKCALALHF